MKIDILSGDREFAATEVVWQDALESSAGPDLFLTYAWFRSWWMHLSQGHELAVYLLSDEKTGTQGIAPLRRVSDRLYFMASHEVSDYCDFLFPQGQEQMFLEAFFAYIGETQPEICSLELINFCPTSPSLSLIPEIAPCFGYKCQRKKSQEVLHLQLPPSYEEYLSSLDRKKRHELRRKLRRTEELNRLRIETKDRPDELRTAMDDFIALHRAGSPEKNRFWETPGMPGFFKDVIVELSRKKMAALHSLYSGDVLAASLITGFYGKTLYLYNVAYAREFAFASPGYFLFDRSIRQAISEGKKTADFLRGREKYKLEFGARSRTIYSLLLTKDLP